MVEQQDYLPIASELNTKLRDIEEKQRLIKDRMLLIGQNLVDFREEAEKNISVLKAETELIKQEILKIKSTLERIIEELSGLARKEEVMILQRQLKMFQPLQFARMEDVEKMIKEKK